MRKAGYLISVVLMTLLPIGLIMASQATIREKNDSKDVSSITETRKIENQAQLIMGDNQVLKSETPTLIVENYDQMFKQKKVVLKNIDADDHTSLAYATFDLKDENGFVIKQDVKVNKSGEVSFKLLPGNYVLVEKKAPAGYWLVSSPISFTVQ